MIEALLIVGIVIASTAWYLRHRWRRRAEIIAIQTIASQHAAGLELLAKRYASGEINRDEYLQMRDDILACPAYLDG